MSVNTLQRLPDKTYQYRGFHITRGTKSTFAADVPKGFGVGYVTLQEKTMRSMKGSIDGMVDKNGSEGDDYSDAPSKGSSLRLAWVKAKYYELARKHFITDWKFKFDKGRRRAGACFWDSKRITISQFHAVESDIEEVVDTLKHEIAHALCGRRVGHGPAWVKRALEIGCNGKRCHNLTFSKAPFVLKCKKGCFKEQRFRGLLNPGKYHCLKCKGKLTLIRNT